MDTIFFLVQQTWFFAIPLLVVALGGLFSERSGVINIALEGIMLIGALCGIGFIHIFNHSMPPQLLLLCAVLVAGAAGIVFSLFHAFAAIHMKADQVISGTALNTFAPAFCIFIARTFQQTQQIQFENVFRIASLHQIRPQSAGGINAGSRRGHPARPGLPQFKCRLVIVVPGGIRVKTGTLIRKTVYSLR